jgi:hypothetical protein
MKATLRILRAVAIFFVSWIVFLLLAAPLWNLTGHFSESTPPPATFRIVTYVVSFVLAIWTTRRFMRHRSD